ncbi:unnamed protein product [Gongylonema pulchrum]|uniref:Uncharacterized protein n=1 Tax=Gongylonema pulchrum TaxID=637853 RepID=A0A183CWU5_9BILA|nr:unnamed protein product [Gongylonema pulchrum]
MVLTCRPSPTDISTMNNVTAGVAATADRGAAECAGSSNYIMPWATVIAMLSLYIFALLWLFKCNSLFL